MRSRAPSNNLRAPLAPRAPTPRPTSRPTPGSGCDYTAQPLAYDSSECPKDADGSVFPNCDEVACGELCEGDGECGTDTQLDNCNCPVDAVRCSIYQKVCDNGGGEVGYAPTYRPTQGPGSGDDS